MRDNVRDTMRDTVRDTMRDIVRDMVLFYLQERTLNRLSSDQLAGVGDSFKRSRDVIALNTVMNKLDKDNALTLASEMSVGVH